MKKSKLDQFPEMTKEQWMNQNNDDKSHLLKSQSKGVKVGFKNADTKSEKTVKSECVAWLKGKGYVTYTVYLGGIPVGFGKLATNPLKGFPDTIVAKPSAPKGKKMFYVEYKKSQGGIVSQEQLNWHALLEACEFKVFIISSLEQAKLEIGEWLK